MLSKLCSIYPLAANEDVELKISALRDELRDVPAMVLSHALRDLVRRKKDFMPTLAEIRESCALIVRSAHRSAHGMDPTAPAPGGLNVEAWIARASEPLPKALPREIEESVSPEERKAAAERLAKLVKKKGWDDGK